MIKTEDFEQQILSLQITHYIQSTAHDKSSLAFIHSTDKYEHFTLTICTLKPT